MQKNLYEILEIPNFSDVDTAKAAYRKLSRKYHPDNFINSSEEIKKENLIKQQLINMAWEILSNEEKKREYDYRLKNPNENKEFNDIFNDFYEDLMKDVYNEEKKIKLQNLERKRYRVKEKIEERKKKIRLDISETKEYNDLLNEKKRIIKIIDDLSNKKIKIEHKLSSKQYELTSLINKKLYHLFPKAYENNKEVILLELNKITFEFNQINSKIEKYKKEFDKIQGNICGGFQKKYEQNDKELNKLIEILKEIEQQIEFETNEYQGKRK